MMKSRTENPHSYLNESFGDGGISGIFQSPPNIIP